MHDQTQSHRRKRKQLAESTGSYAIPGDDRELRRGSKLWHALVGHFVCRGESTNRER